MNYRRPGDVVKRRFLLRGGVYVRCEGQVGTGWRLNPEAKAPAPGGVVVRFGRASEAVRERLGGKEDMFNFFRKTQDSKKVSLPEREADGFVLLDASVLTAQEPENASRGMIPDTQVVIQLMNREEHLKIKIHFLRQDLHTVNLFSQIQKNIHI
nr:UBAP1-MVB12-associated (UMA)-domain containing protein 1 isoform X5 [Chrysemys picta bellii]